MRRCENRSGFDPQNWDLIPVVCPNNLYPREGVMRFFTFILALSALLTCSAVGQMSQGDANGDGTIDISDPVYLISYIFSGGDKPAAVWLPRMAFAKADTIELTLPPQQWTPLLYASIHVPVAGLILVEGTMGIYANGGSPYLQIGLDSIPTAAGFTEYNGTNGGNILSTIPISHTFACDSGTVSVYLNVKNGYGANGLFRFDSPRLNVLFVPNGSK